MGTTNGITIADESGNTVPGASRLRFVGAGAVVAPGGSGGVDVTLTASIDPTGVDAVIDGGAWVTRNLVQTPGYEIIVTAGRGVIRGAMVTWKQTRVTTPPYNAVIVVGTDGTVRARAVSAPELLPQVNELLLLRTYVDTAQYGNRIYAVAESRTFHRVTPRAPLFLTSRVQESVIASGAWAGAVAVNGIGDLNFYFANLGLYPFVEELPSIVRNHLDVQIAKHYGATGTANGSPSWQTLHGTAYTGQVRWPYDVTTPREAPTPKRADSHDAYASSFLRLAARYAQIASGGLAWWDANIVAIQDALYFNVLLRLRLVNNGAGYLCDTFQDSAVYPFAQTLDNMEAYAGAKAALALMVQRGGQQASWANGFIGTPANLALGLSSQWSTTPNVAGEAGWLSTHYDINAGALLPNPLTRFYPYLTTAVAAAVYDAPLHGTDAIHRERLRASFDWLNAKSPAWYMSRKYDLYPWGMLAAAAAKVGFRELAERWLNFVQVHHAYDAPGFLQIHDLGWARYVERVLAGERLT